MPPRGRRRGATRTARSGAPRLLALANESLGHTSTKFGTSRWKERWRCGRAHYLRYKLGLRSLQEAKALAIGTACHNVLAFVSMAEIKGFDQEEVDWKLPLALMLKKRTFRELTTEVVAETNRIMSEYWRVHDRTVNAGWPKRWKLVAVEVFVEDPTMPITTQLDLVVRDSELDNRLVVVNHKTAASMLSAFERPFGVESGEPFLADDDTRLLLCADAQALAEAHMAGVHYGEKPVMCRHIITKAKNAKFSRVLYEPTQHQLDQWRESELALRDIYDVNEDLYDSLMNHNECSSSIGNLKCWAFEYCHGTDEQREELYQVRADAKRNAVRRKKSEDNDGDDSNGKEKSHREKRRRKTNYRRKNPRT